MDCRTFFFFPEFVRMKACCLLINLKILLLGFNPVNYNNYPIYAYFNVVSAAILNWNVGMCVIVLSVQTQYCCWML